MANPGIVVPAGAFTQEQLDDFAALLARCVSRGNIGWLATRVMGSGALQPAGNDIGDTLAFAQCIVKTLNEASRIPEAIAVLRQEAHRNSALMFWLTQILSGRRLDDSDAMQAFVNDYEPFLNSAEMQQSLPKFLRTVCAVALGDPVNKICGSGFLIASDLVMTNYHVVKQFVKWVDGKPVADAPGKELYFFFDYLSEPSPGVPPKAAGHACYIVNAAEKWLEYAREDMPFDGQPEADADAGTRFDCAIVRLERHVGKLPARKSGGVLRGWLPLPQEEIDVWNNRRVMVFQHPGTAPQHFDIGDYIELDATKTRVRYTVSAAKGSSGGAAVDIRGSLFALHNAEVRGRQAPGGRAMNQGIRIDCIVKDLAAQAPGVFASAKPADDRNLFWSLNDDLNDPQPIIGRTEFREMVAKMMAPDGPRVGLVTGAPGSGLNFSVPLLHRIVGPQTPVVMLRPVDLQTLKPDGLLRVLVDELNISNLAGHPMPSPKSTENSPRWLRLDLPRWLFDRLSEDEKRDRSRYPAWVVINTIVPEDQRLLWAENLKEFLLGLIGAHDPAQRSVDLPQLRWLFLARSTPPFAGVPFLWEALDEYKTWEKDFAECVQTAWYSIDKTAEMLNEVLLSNMAQYVEENRPDGVPLRKALADCVRRLIRKEVRK